MKMLQAEREIESDSVNRVILGLLKDYNPSDVKITNGEDGFELRIYDEIVPIPEFSAKSESINLSADTYNHLQKCKSHPDEALNTTIFKLISYKHTNILPHEKANKALVRAIGEYGIYFFYAHGDDLTELTKLFTNAGRTCSAVSHEDKNDAITALNNLAVKIFEKQGSFGRDRINNHKERIIDHLN
jgi:bisphosphoglycerate-dependent phosphoglycerate mutase